MSPNSFALNVYVDPASLAKAARMADFEMLLAAHLMAAQEAGLLEVEDAATEYMWSNFRNPTGPLESAWEKDVQSPWLGILTNTSAYGQRRHFGFSGKTDALGRYYPLDPGILWAENAASIATPYVEAIFTDEFNQAIGDV